MDNRSSSPSQSPSAPLLGSPLRYPVLPPGYSDAEQNTTGYQSGLPAGYYNNPESSCDYNQPQIGVIGSCPACRVGVPDDHFTCCGILCAIFLFPIGLICCLATRQRRCSNCGAVFG